LMRENASFDFASRIHDGNASWRPYATVPSICALSSGAFTQDPSWYRNFRYAQEGLRGLDCIEDLASPGIFRFALERGEAVLVLRTGDDIAQDATRVATQLRNEESRR